MERAPVPYLPPEISESIIQYLVNCQAHTLDNIKNVRNFRLISKAFADIGLPYLICTIRLIRLPSSFDKAEQIANHPRARSYVKELICYGNVIRSKCLLPKDKNHHQACIKDSGEDMTRLQQLIQKLHNLKTIQLDNLRNEYRIDKSKLRRIVAARLGEISRLGYDCEGFVDIGILNVLRDSGRMDQLILSRVDRSMIYRLPYHGFEALRRLSIHYKHIDSGRLPLPPLWNTLELFEFRCSSLEYMYMDHFLPKGLKYLGLSGVEIPVDYLPKTLEEIWLDNVKLQGKIMASWVDVFLNWPHDCELFVSGPLVADTDGYPWGDEDLTSWDRILDSTLGRVLKEICSAPRRFADNFREALLREIFESSIMTMREDYSFKTAIICISQKITAVYASMDHPPVKESIPKWARLMRHS